MYVDVYRTADRALRLAHAGSSLVSQSPRYVIETAAMVLIAILAYAMSHGPGGIGAAIPTLSALALGVQRLLPAMQQ